MELLRQQVARAQRRMVLEQFLGRCVWCLLATLVVAAVAIAAPRVVAIAGLPPRWDVFWLAGGAALGFAVAAGWTLAARKTSLEAACEIDRRYGLRERVASSLSLSPDQRASAAGQALLHDTRRAAGRIDVGDRFRVRLDRRAWLPLVPTALALLVVVLFDPREATSSAAAVSPAAIDQQIKQATDSARKKLEQQRKQAQGQRLEEAERLFRQIEQGTRELSESNEVDRTEAAVKLNNLADQLEQRRRQLGGPDALREQFQRMKHLGAGPGQQMAEAIQRGDMDQARQQLESLARQLDQGQLDPEAARQLAQQLQQMREAIEKAAAAGQQAAAELQQQIEQAQHRGDLAEAGQLQQQLDRLRSELPQAQGLEPLAQEMGRMQQALKQGDVQQAADALDRLAEQMNQLAQQSSESEMLDSAMNDLQMAKSAMACQQCQGQSCAACQGAMAGSSTAPAPPGSGNSLNNSTGPGIGTGSSRDVPPEAPVDSSGQESHVRQQPGQGAAAFGGMVEGPNVRGQVGQSIREEMTRQGAEPADPLDIQALPRSRRQHASDYFNALREGP